VLLLGRLKHPNLVRLLGYCTEKDEAALVYDFLPNGSLDSWLFQRQWPRSLLLTLALSHTPKHRLNAASPDGGTGGIRGVEGGEDCCC